MGGYGVGLSGLEQGPMAAFCEFGLCKMTECVLDKSITLFPASKDALRSILVN